MVAEKEVWEALKQVIDPELGVNIVDLGLVYEVHCTPEGRVQVKMTMTTPACPLSRYLTDAVEAALWRLDGVSAVDVQLVWDPPWHAGMMTEEAKRALGWIR
ncbi:metal-sulfur cluster assembly factor [Ardenticatena maritima]|uniref:MIP18 family-like domain-containing protein n=1 Tax=Ardenticatena maritima TaxID=872965 RepID=A0A0P6YP07_9CHLR|nr:metal-sulfur cluster assembly factor [Ardenticatena maritima]KPL86968.1 hypothetical protein SE16_12940 [Ardenticatena maritima]